MHPIADITGDNATHYLDAAYGVNVHFSQMWLIVTGSGTVRVGGAGNGQNGNSDAATSPLGLPVTATLPMQINYRGELNWSAMLKGISVYVPSGSTLSVAFTD